MKTIGLWLFIFGAGSIALNQIGMEFRLLMWVDTWGPTVAWAIRGGACAVGLALFFLAKSPSRQGETA